jgi:hypothetical protein
MEKTLREEIATLTSRIIKLEKRVSKLSQRIEECEPVKVPDGKLSKPHIVKKTTKASKPKPLSAKDPYLEGIMNHDDYTKG